VERDRGHRLPWFASDRGLIAGNTTTRLRGISAMWPARSPAQIAGGHGD
jgi:hypothetical protein